MKQSELIVRITGSFDQGSIGIDRDPKNPVSRAFDRFLITGKPPGKHASCYFIDDAGTWRWFGVFGFSEGMSYLDGEISGSATSGWRFGRGYQKIFRVGETLRHGSYLLRILSRGPR